MRAKTHWSLHDRPSLMDKPMKIVETDDAGNTSAVYIESTSAGEKVASSRIDIIVGILSTPAVFPVQFSQG